MITKLDKRRNKDSFFSPFHSYDFPMQGSVHVLDFYNVSVTFMLAICLSKYCCQAYKLESKSLTP